MRIGFIVFIYICMPMLIVWAFQKWRWAQKVGTVIMAYAVGIVLSLSNLTVFESGSAEAETMRSIQKWIMDCTVPLAIPLMLLGSDFRMWAKSLPKTIIALVGGLFAVVVAVCSGFFVFRGSGIENFSDLAAMMIGISFDLRHLILERYCVDSVPKAYSFSSIRTKPILYIEKLVAPVAPQ